jgi:hypothetical protein
VDAEWNPRSPVTLGVEFTGRGTSTKRIAAAVEQQVIRWAAQASGDMDGVSLFPDAGSSAPYFKTGPAPLYADAVANVHEAFGGTTIALRAGILAELLERASELHDGSDTTVNTYAVSQVDTGIGRDFREIATTADAAVDDVVTALDGLAAWNGDTLPCTMGLRFDTSGFPADRHVVAIEFEVRTFGATWACIEEKTGGGFFAHVDSVTWNQAEAGTTFIRFGELYPHLFTAPYELRWWTTDRVRSFDVGGDFRLVLATQSLETVSSIHYIDYVAMHVYSVPERRAGVGVIAPVAGAWATADLLTPDAAGAPAVVSGDDYSLIVRPPVAGGGGASSPTATMRLRRLRGTPPFADYEVRSVTDYDTTGSQQATGVGAVEDVLVPWLALDGATILGESIPDRISTAYRLPAALDVSDMNVQFPTVGAATWDVGYAIVATEFAVDDTLTVRLQPNFDPLVGTTRTAVVTAAEAAASPEVARSAVTVDGVTRTVSWRRVRLDFGAGVTGTTAYMAAAGEDWLFAAMSHRAVDADASFLGATDSRGVLLDGDDTSEPGPWTDDNSDAQVVISQKPNPPNAVGATVVTGDYGGVSHDHVTVTWAAPTGGAPADFGGYEIERWDARTGWAPVALIADDTQTSWDDHEARLGEETTYRMRTVRGGDDIAGDWETTDPVTVPAPDGCLLSFSSNEAPDDGLAYADVYQGDPARAYAFPEAAETVTHRIYGRDYVAAFRPTEVRGVAFTRVLDIVHADDAGTFPSPQGPDQFAPLRALARADLSYVCVRDGDGNRWFASITVPDGVSRVWAGAHKATVNVTETTATPTIVTA